MRYIQVVGVDDEQSSPAILLVNGQTRYLFNCGETLQRFGFQHKLRVFARLDGIFLGQINAHTIGGMPGMMMTMSSTSISGTAVVGPEGLREYLWGTRHFFRRPNFNIRTYEAPGKIDLSKVPPPIVLGVRDEQIKLFAISFEVNPQSQVGPEGLSAGDVPTSTNCNSHFNFHEMQVYTRIPKPRRRTRRMGPAVVSYVCHTADKAGKFHPAKAKALGIPPGPLFSQLVRGNPVTLADGTVIQPEQCVDSKIAGPAFAIVTCPSMAVLDQLSKSALFCRYQFDQDSTSTTHARLSCIVHIAPAEILQHPKYIQWTKAFGAKTQHISIAGSATTEAARNAAATTEPATDEQPFPMFVSHTCRLLDLGQEYPDYFTTGATNYVKQHLASDSTPVVPSPSKPNSLFVQAQYLLKYFLLPVRYRGKPQPVLNREHCVTLETYKKELLEKSASNRKVTRVPNHVPTQTTSQANIGRFIHGDSELLKQSRLFFLGTGAAVPTKYRNVSGILLRLCRHRVVSTPASATNAETVDILMDAGEGTYSQLVQLFGITEALRCLRGLQLIWISHMHADHHLGLLKILTARQQRLPSDSSGTRAPPVIVVGPPELAWWLQDYSNVDTTICGSYHFVDAFDLQVAGAPRRRAVPKPPENKPNPCCHSERASDPVEPTAMPATVENVGSIKDANGELPPLSAAQRRVHQSTGITFSTVRVLHPCNSFACILDIELRAIDKMPTAAGTARLVYSGDTKPCDALIHAGQGATILIHEATFDSSLSDEALKRHHSTVGQAVNVACRMNAFRTVLTHFSARYKRIPDIISSLTNSSGEDQVSKESSLRATYSLAFDHMVRTVIPAIAGLYRLARVIAF